jgi:hypothetical protein
VILGGDHRATLRPSEIPPEGGTTNAYTVPENILSQFFCRLDRTIVVSKVSAK